MQFEFKKVYLLICLSKEEVISKLRENIDTTPGVLQFYRKSSIFGSVSNEKIKIFFWKNKLIRNSFAPVLYGEIKQDRNQTKIEGAFSFSREIKLFGLVFIGTLLFSKIHWAIKILSLSGFFLLAAIGWGFSSREQTEIQKFLENLFQNELKK